MQPHPDFEGAAIPTEVDLGAFRLTPLTGAQVQEDYAAVTGAADLLRGFFGGTWPDGLTLEENLTDLHWHHREFTTNRSFSWIIRDAEGRYLGCAYINPKIGARGAADGFAWLGAISDREAWAKTIFPALQDWATGTLPPGVSLTWTLSPS